MRSKRARSRSVFRTSSIHGPAARDRRARGDEAVDGEARAARRGDDWPRAARTVRARQGSASASGTPGEERCPTAVRVRVEETVGASRRCSSSPACWRDAAPAAREAHKGDAGDPRDGGVAMGRATRARRCACRGSVDRRGDRRDAVISIGGAFPIGTFRAAAVDGRDIRDHCSRHWGSTEFESKKYWPPWIMLRRVPGVVGFAMSSLPSPSRAKTPAR